MYLEQAKTEYTKSSPNQASNVRPCSESEIETLEEQFSIKFPAAYREFLLWMGHDGSDFWGSYAWVCQDLREANESARQLMRETNTGMYLPDDAFIFYWDYGGSFYFYRTNEGDDPPVYFVLNPATEQSLRKSYKKRGIPSNNPLDLYVAEHHKGQDFYRRSARFSDFILSEIERYIRMIGDSGNI